MKKKRVLLLRTQSLLSDGLTSMLKKIEHLDVHVLHIPCLNPIDRIAAIQPEIVLVVCTGDLEYQRALMMKIFEMCPELPIVQIQVTHNEMQVYHNHKMPATREGLLHLILNNPAPPLLLSENMRNDKNHYESKIPTQTQIPEDR